MQIGDFVVLPRRDRYALAVGRITGECVFRADAEPGLRHIRQVEWKRSDLDRDVVKQDLLYSMGSLMTVFELRRANAAERVAALFDHGTDPGPVDDDAPVDQPLSLTLRELIDAWPGGGMSRCSPRSRTTSRTRGPPPAH